MADTRDPRGRFLAGGPSPNPDGRPKVARTIRDLARSHGTEAFEKLLEHMRGTNPELSMRAALAVLERGFGRPAQVLTMSSDDELPHGHDENELTGAALEALQALALGRTEGNA